MKNDPAIYAKRCKPPYRHESFEMIKGHAKRPTLAFTDIDFEKNGRQIGFVMFPDSPQDDAWGVTRVPIAVIATDAGPR